MYIDTCALQVNKLLLLLLLLNVVCKGFRINPYTYANYSARVNQVCRYKGRRDRWIAHWFLSSRLQARRLQLTT